MKKGIYVFFVMAVFLLGVGAFLIAPNNEVTYEQLENDVNIDSSINSYMKGNDLIIEIDTNEDEVWIEGISKNKYTIEDDKMILYNYKDEKFLLHIGAESDVYAFGEITDKQKDLLNETRIEELRNTDTTRETYDDKKYKSYDSVEKKILIEDDKEEVIIEMKLISPYTTSGLIASDDTKVADFLLIDWKDGKISLIDSMDFYDAKSLYEETNKDFRFKYGTEVEECSEGDCHNETIWTEFETLSELPHKNIKVSLWANTKTREHIEWIPTIEGFEIEQWAAWKISSYAYNGKDFQPVSQPKGIYFSDDGTKMYVAADQGTNAVTQYTLSDVTNLSTATYDSVSFNILGTSVLSLAFSLNGTSMYVATGANIDQYSLSSAWDLSTASTTGTIYGVPSIKGFYFKPNGLSFFIAFSAVAEDFIKEYNMSTAWNVSTATFVKEFDVGGQDGDVTGVALNDDGTVLFMTGDGNNKIYQYNLSEAWNISTMVYTELSLSTVSSLPGDIYINRTSGIRLYTTDSNANRVYQYDLQILALEITNPVDATNYSIAPTTLTWTYDVADTCKYSNNSGATNTTVTCGDLSTAISPVEGSNTYIMWADDGVDEISDSVTFLVDTIEPVTSIIYPTATTYTFSPLLMNFSATDDNLNNCWYNIGASNVSTSCSANITGISGSEGSNTWIIYANDTSGNIGSSSVTFTIDTSLPEVSIIYPTTTSYTIDITTLNFTAIDATLDTCWYNIGASNITTSCATNVTGLLANQGSNTWAVYANDTGGGEGSDSVTFSVDSITPTFVVESPVGAYDYFVVGDNETLNITFTDSNLDSCWYNYAGTNVSIDGCLTGVKNSTLFIIEDDSTNMTVYVNDTFGNLNATNINWSYVILETAQSYEEDSFETAVSPFTINITYDSSAWSSVVGKLIYNETSYIGISGGAGDDITFSYDLTVPISGEAVNNTFYWLFTLTNATASYNYTSASFNQSVSTILFSLCDYSEDPQLFFQTYSTLEPSTVVNATFASAWTISTTNGEDIALSASFEDTSETNSTWGFCISPNSTDYTVNVVITVDATNYTSTTHFIVDTDFTSVTQNISIYLLHDDFAVLTEIQVVDQDNVPVENVYTTIQRYDIGTDTYYNVAMTRSDSSGSDLAYLKWFDDWYKFIGVLDGIVVFTDGPKKISSTPQLFKTGEVEALDYEKFQEVLYTLIFNNETDNFVLTYVDPTGLVTNNCLRVIKRNVTADYLICDNCETSSSATVYCNIAAYGNGTFISSYYAEGSPIYWIDQLYLDKNSPNNLFLMIGNDNGTGLAILVAGIVLSLFLVSPALGVMGAILGMILSIALGFQPLDYISFVGIIFIGGMIMWAVRK